MSTTRTDFKLQMRRQSTWLRESLLWLMDNRMLSNRRRPDAPVNALEVGCGPGDVMEIVGLRANVKGVDIDPDMVRECRSRGLDASIASGEDLPFEDNTFDLVYCSFLLLWVKDPIRVVSEMRRVSKGWVACLAEPDFGGRLSYPDEMRALDKYVVDGIRKDGGDPFIGRKLRATFAESGMNAEMGTHPGIWSIERLKEESAGEWRWVRMTVDLERHGQELEDIERVWSQALDDGSLFQFNPIFYALAMK